MTQTLTTTLRALIVISWPDITIHAPYTVHIGNTKNCNLK